jgi:F0F1-type ATP synthase assembly protein I
MPPLSSNSWGKGVGYMALGIEFATIVVAGVLLGSYLDGRLGTMPLFTLLLTLGGMVGALYRLLWSLNRSRSQSDSPPARAPRAGEHSSNSDDGD